MIIGFFNATNGRYYDLDELECMARVMDSAVLRDVVRREAEDEAHRGTALTVTAGVGGPRKLAIQRVLPTRPDPQKMWAALSGTYLHDKFAELKKLDKGWTTESNGGKDKCTFRGRLFGYEIAGRGGAFPTHEGGEMAGGRDDKAKNGGAGAAGGGLGGRGVVWAGGSNFCCRR